MLYADIVDMALSYADKQSTEITSRMDKFIAIVEARVNRYLMTQDMSLNFTIPGVLNQATYSLPSDFLALRDLKITDSTAPASNVSTSYISPEQMNNAITNNALVQYYTINNNQIIIQPTILATQNIVLSYFARIAALTTLNTSNWLSLLNPDCYIFGLLVEINAFVKDPIATQLWDGRFQDILGSIDLQNAKSIWNGPALTTKVG